MTMSRFALIAAIAVLGAALLGGALLVGGSRDTSPGPTPAPSTAVVTAVPSVAPSAPATALPASLQYRWIGQPRDVPGLGTSTRTGLNFGAGTFYLSGTEYGLYVQTLLASTASVAADGRLRLETAPTGVSCAAGAVGSYPWSLSAGGTILTVSPGTDACAARAAALPGSWHRIACTNTESGCYGLLEAGTYETQYIAPRLDIGALWEPDLGAMTYTVPAGWANSSDWPNTFTLTPAADYATEGPDGPPDGHVHEIYLFTQPSAADQDATCSGTPDVKVDRSVSGLVAWLRTLKSVVVSNASTVTIDGHPGTMVDIGIANTWKTACPGDTSPGALLFAQDGRENFYNLGIVGAERGRLILLDLGGGDVLGILIDSGDPARFDELASAAMPIIQSMHIK
jgi:hypothetical protein